MIIRRYIFLEILRPMALVCLVLVVIFASFSSAAYLADAAHGLLSGRAVLQLTALKTLIGLEALLPTAFYLAVIIGLGRLYHDSEMTALAASGFSEFQVLKTTAILALGVAILVAALTLHVRPWAYHTIYETEARSLAELDLDKLEGGRFYRLGNTDYVLFAARVDRDENRLHDVFFRSTPARDSTQIIRARQAYLSRTEAGQPAMVFLDGFGYSLADGTQQDLTLRFKTLTLPLEGFAHEGVGYKRKALPLARLAQSEHSGDLAEYQWRLSMPVATLILGLLAVPLSRSRPRHGRFARLFAALLVYALYYNLLTLAKTWLDQGKVAPLPGLWWAHVIPALLLLALLLQPYVRLRRTGRRPETAIPSSGTTAS